MQQDQELRVALGNVSYGVTAPWGDLPATAGKVTDVACAPDGDVFVLTRRDCRIEPALPAVHHFDAEGHCVARFGAAELADAHKLVVGPDGRIWVVDRDAHEIIAFDRDGTVSARLGTRNGPGAPFSHPTDIAFLSGGEIVVADGYAAGWIHIFTPEGAPLDSFGSVGREPGAFLVPHAVGVLSDDRIVVADRENGRVQIFATNGELLAIQDVFVRPQDVWVAPDDTILVSDSIPTLTRIDADGCILGRGRATLNGPHGMCGSASGAIYLAENNPSRITRILPLVSTAMDIAAE